ncbi:MAG TPA: fatty acid cis/trans isomerase, partial [Polyangiales bacterium]
MPVSRRALRSGRWPLLLSACLLFACARPRVPEASRSAAAGAQSSQAPEQLWSAAKTTLEQRCVVCHGCYDAPCQLQLGSFEGIERGASQIAVYEGSRLRAIDPTRLFVDAPSTPAWRDKGFFPVLPAQPADAAESLLVRMLQLKRQHPQPTTPTLSASDFDFEVERDQVCAEADDFDGFAKDHPLWGMPYGLPGVTEAEHAAIVGWVQAGSPHVHEPVLGPEVLREIDVWEQFFNEPSLKTQLFARYIYEHLFLASLYFHGLEERTFFRLVRSRTPPGQAVQEIPTRRPFDDPGPGRVYYRLVRRVGRTLLKTHMPYALSQQRLSRWRELFVEPQYQVKKLPAYDPVTAANPFKAFVDLPVRSRYRFMLEEAEFTMMGFIKGPVCRGQVALDVIEDRFWISFVDPESQVVASEADLLAR